MSEFKFPDELEDEKDVTIDIETGDTDIEVEIVDDTPEQDRGRQKLEEPVEDPTDEELENYSSKVQDRIKKLTHARHDERRAKESTLRENQELERLAQSLLAENKQLKGYVEQGTKQIAASGLSAAEAEMEKARRQYKEAQESFDTDAIIAAQEAMTDAKFNLERAKNFRPAPLQTYSDSVQTQQPVARQEKPDQKSLRWQAKNQWFGSEGFEEITSYSLGLHQKLVNSGIDPQSDEYYAQIDNSVRSKFPEVFGSSRSEKNQSEKSQRPASVVAPATRSSGPKKIQISQRALALAKKFGLTPQQYAAQVALLES
jgi:hypothetical protein